MKKYDTIYLLSDNMPILSDFYDSIRRCGQWQNAKSAVRALHLELRFPTHTEEQTEHGNQT